MVYDKMARIILFLLVIKLSLWPLMLSAWENPKPDLKNIYQKASILTGVGNTKPGHIKRLTRTSGVPKLTGRQNFGLVQLLGLLPSLHLGIRARHINSCRPKGPKSIANSIEYRLFNLLIKVPLSFSVEEVNPFRVIFKNVPNSGIGKNAAIIEFYYFPKNLIKKSPKSNLEFVKRVWPEYLETVRSPGNKLIAIDKKILKSVFLNPRQKIQSLMFKSSNSRKQKTRIYLFHWQDRSRIYFIQVMVLNRHFERYRSTIQGILESVKVIFEKGDSKKIKKLINNLFKNVQTVPGVTKPKISFINKNFLKPFYFQGRIWDPLDSLKLLKGFEAIPGGIILLEQDDLSFTGSKKLEIEQLLRIKEYMKEFKRIFTSGDIGALVRMGSKSGDHGQKKPINKATWSYLLLRKVRNDWLIYAIGISIPSLQSSKKDSTEKIIW